MGRLWMMPTYLILAGVLLGPLGATTGLLGGLSGFYIFLGSILLAAVSAIGLGGAAAFASATGKLWRGAAVRATVVPLVLVVGAWTLRGDGNPFNDVTTDLANPPVWSIEVVEDSSYPEAFVEIHKTNYPDLAPIASSLPPDEAYASVVAAARSMPGWEVTREDPEARIVEAVATSRIFRFQDDVVIRVKQQAPGSRIDVRSRSRVGQGDLGANYARIKAFRANYETGVAAR
jgi:uncharacterized protein (DUF1499 family)